MNTAILNKEVQDFIKNFKGDYNRLAFSKSPFPNILPQELIRQIKGYSKIKNKLPTWAKCTDIIFPPSINLEQSSSEITASYKASLVTGDTLADLTGGFGVDTYYFSKSFNQVDYFEVNQDLFEITTHNFKQLDVKNITCNPKDGLQNLLKTKYDVVYIDPSRRHTSKGKVFFLSDCLPNVPKNINTIIKDTKTVLVKTSPMLDISIGIEELKYAQDLHIIAVNNEVKELVWLLKKKRTTDLVIHTVNFTKTTLQKQHFIFSETASVTYSTPDLYLYEPNASILKSGKQDLLCNNYKVKKLHRHSHLFTSNKLVDFPGRRFKIVMTKPYKKKIIGKILNNKKANISIRNFPESVAEIRKKWKILDGGTTYLFFTTLVDSSKVVLVCEKV